MFSLRATFQFLVTSENIVKLLVINLSFKVKTRAHLQLLVFPRMCHVVNCKSQNRLIISDVRPLFLEERMDSNRVNKLTILYGMSCSLNKNF